MNGKFLVFVGLLIPAVASSQTMPAGRLIGPTDHHIESEGRIGFQRDSAAMYWPGTSFSLAFTGTGIQVILRDEKANDYYDLLVDDSLVQVLRVGMLKKNYLMASGLAPGKHRAAIFRRGDWTRGRTWFYGFVLQGHPALPAPAAKKRRIEFYGNSITVGYSVEDQTSDSEDSSFTNNYRSYAAITARHFDAHYTCIAMSGIGVMVSWFPVIMPELYDRLDPADSSSLWNFAKATPDIVVVDLFQNDCWILQKKDHPQYLRRFGSGVPSEEFIVHAYANFITRLRHHYPLAEIICSLGCMDATKPGAPWEGYIQKAVDLLKDPKIKTFFFPYDPRNSHPKIERQQEMAGELIKFISGITGW